ncbi:MAG: hypothetical protein DWQ07_04415 [Chloroflexi bacterium]|nr:MAG: hypothetical protein DWQ07_04415 [Chloroflexota bacterium]MBL1194677.1 hypothetical protein [Chloroflexota bacterium]NOH11968.1 hypothetical protein [Chloroflexota bacterium]
MTEHMKIAKLDTDQVSKIQALENELGMHMLAFGDNHAIANLSEDQLNQIQTLEKELGVTLVVYQG